MNQNNELTQYVDKLYSAALRKSGDSYVAEELAQEVCLAALQAFARGKAPEKLWPWLLAILSNKYCDRLRRQYNEPVVSYDSFPLELPQEETDGDTAEMLEAVRRELGYLAKIHREVMVRYYLRGESVDIIARALDIPAGTVKSRLNTGRRQIKEGVTEMENYTANSYAPDSMYISCSGGSGYDNEPFSLVEDNDTLTQNVLLMAYEKPVTPTELARALGVPVPYIEPILERLLRGELMQRTDSGKVYTDFIIYTPEDKRATFQKQLDLVRANFPLFWEGTAEGLAALRGQEYYRRQSEEAKPKLELHFLLKLLCAVQMDARNEVTGFLPYSEYPYRKNGGRWFAMGNHYPHDYNAKPDNEMWNHSVSGQSSVGVKNFRDAASVEVWEYSTSLGGYPYHGNNGEYVKWLYEVYLGVTGSDSGVPENVPEAAARFVKHGILNRENGLTLAIPVLTPAEFRAECALAEEYQHKVYARVREVMRPLFEEGYVRLPAHLKSVPKWLQYMHCSDSVPMAVIHKAIADGLLFSGVQAPIPASLLVVEKK